MRAPTARPACADGSVGNPIDSDGVNQDPRWCPPGTSSPRIALLLLLACTTAPIARGDGFRVPVPKGFRLATGPDADAVARSGGVLLVELEAVPEELPFLGNIVIGPPRMSSFNPEDAATCASAAGQMTMWTGGTVKKSGIVETRWGRSCQLEVEGSKEHVHRIGRATVMPSGSSNWMITCNLDARDPRAQQACDAVLASVETIPGARPDSLPSQPSPAVAARPPERSRGAGYSVVVPPGFRALPASVPSATNPQVEALLRAGGLVLVEEARPAVGDPFLASIVITPAAEERLDADSARCASVAAEMARSTGTAVSRQAIVEMPWGKTCQVEVAASTGQPNRGGRWTVMRAASKTWMVTCNFDLRDKPARDACDAVLASVTTDGDAAAAGQAAARATCESMAAAGELKKGVSVGDCADRLSR